MANEFGSPNERDDIARVERGIESVVQRKAQHFESVVNRLAPRAIGSQKMSQQDRLMDNTLTLLDVDDPVQAGYDWVQERAGQYGLAKALEMYADEISWTQDYVRKNTPRE